MRLFLYHLKNIMADLEHVGDQDGFRQHLECAKSDLVDTIKRRPGEWQQLHVRFQYNDMEYLVYYVDWENRISKYMRRKIS